MPEESEPLQSLIADILESENRGDTVDREAFLRQHTDHADSLREFFANHDSMKAKSSSEDMTLPPSDPNSAVDATQHPSNVSSGEEATLAARDSTSFDEATVGDRVRYFGDYELLEEIARGGMGVVYKARQVNLNRIVALKMILAGQLAGEEDVKRFYTEAEAAANLDHTGIVPIFEVGQHQGQYYFSMGYIEGQSLAQKVADGPLTPREAAELVKKICEAMAYAHERGVIHRDLKPANILLDQNGQPKVTDFGLAKQMNVDSGLTGTGQILGTPSYMAPEQASGKIDEVGPLADVYALGAILYCLLTGRPPFQAANPMDTLLQVLENEPVNPKRLNSHVEKELSIITLKCLRKEMENRYSSVQQLASDLQNWLHNKPIIARAVSITERLSKWAERRPASAILLSLGFIPLAYILAALIEIQSSGDTLTVLTALTILMGLPILTVTIGILRGLACGELSKFSMRALVGGLISGFLAGFLILFCSVIYSSLPSLLPSGNEDVVGMVQEFSRATGIAAAIILSGKAIVGAYRFEPCVAIGFRVWDALTWGLLAGFTWACFLFIDTWVSVLFAVLTTICMFGLLIAGDRAIFSACSINRRNTRFGFSVATGVTTGLIWVRRLGTIVLALNLPTLLLLMGDGLNLNSEYVIRYSLPVGRFLQDRRDLSDPESVGGWRLIYTFAKDAGISSHLITSLIERRLTFNSSGSFQYDLDNSITVRTLGERSIEVLVSHKYPGGLEAIKSKLRWTGKLEVALVEDAATNDTVQSVANFYSGSYVSQLSSYRSKNEEQDSHSDILGIRRMSGQQLVDQRMVRTAEISQGAFMIDRSLHITRTGVSLYVQFNPCGRDAIEQLGSSNDVVLIMDDLIVSDRYSIGAFVCRGLSHVDREGMATAINCGPLPMSLELVKQERFNRSGGN